MLSNRTSAVRQYEKNQTEESCELNLSIGYLAPRAAAFDDRIDGVVAYDVFIDMGASARRYAPSAAFWLHDNGLAPLVDAFARAKAAFSPGFAWATANGMWTLSTKHALDMIEALQKYTLDGVAQRIKGHVFILAGAEDLCRLSRLSNSKNC